MASDAPPPADALLSKSVSVRKQAEAIIARSLDSAAGDGSGSGGSSADGEAATLMRSRARQAQRLLSRSIGISRQLEALEDTATAGDISGSAADAQHAQQWDAFREASALADNMQGWLQKVRAGSCARIRGMRTFVAARMTCSVV